MGTKKSIDEFLDDSDNDIKPDNRFPEPGNGKYKFVPRVHEWSSYDGIGTFIAVIEVVSASPIANGLREWKGEKIEMSQPGDTVAIKIWGFGKSDRHNMAVGKLKSYLGSLLAHKGVTAKGKHDFIKMAKQLVNNANDEKVKALLADASISAQVEVNPPADPTNAKATPWRLISYL